MFPYLPMTYGIFKIIFVNDPAAISGPYRTASTVEHQL